jgi:tetratricopeptide (TPR) repeat protein
MANDRGGEDGTGRNALRKGVPAGLVFIMSRFVNLELGNEAEDPSRPQQKALVKDEAYYFSEAHTAFEAGDFEQALRLYGKVLEFNTQNAAAWTGQVRMLIELGEFHEAKLWADKALERFPNEPELLAAKAVALGRSGDLQGALAFSDSSIEEHGDTPYVWLARGDVLLAREEPRADYCFEKARLLAPRDWLTHWLAARIRFYYRQFVLALKLLQAAIEWNAGHFRLWLELGQCQQALDLIGPAKKSFQQAQLLNPHCREANLELIRLSGTGLGARLRGWGRQLFNR